MSHHTPTNSRIPLLTLIYRIPQVLVPLSILLTTWLYLYPVFLGCVFPSIDGRFDTAISDTLVQHRDSAHVNPLDTRPHLAPFRLLVLADPQLEGDSSLPDPDDALLNKIANHWGRLASLGISDTPRAFAILREVATELFQENIPTSVKALRKRLDLFGNDYYLAHIYRTLHWWTKPTHVTVLGDLIGSQWVDDEEFEWRGWRYWNRVFAGAEKVPADLMEATKQGVGIVVPMDEPRWSNRIINIAGNHDIGYAGDISRRRVERFEEKYGLANWDLRFSYPTSRVDENATPERPVLHLVVLNSMLLDTPPMEQELQDENYAYLNEVISKRLRSVEDRSDFTLLLTHVPLHKDEGICVDAPLFNFWDEDDCSDDDCKPGALKEQNHLSEFVSQNGLLQAIFGMGGGLESPARGKGRPGLVLTGHDHEGCDVWHYVPSNSTFTESDKTEAGEEVKTVWNASRWKQADLSKAHTGIREITLRSMMGEFGGNAGLLSAWFDFTRKEWQYEITMCKLGVQHIWWAVHIIDLLALASVLLATLLRIQQMPTTNKLKKRPGKKVVKTE